MKSLLASAERNESGVVVFLSIAKLCSKFFDLLIMFNSFSFWV